MIYGSRLMIYQVIFFIYNINKWMNIISIILSSYELIQSEKAACSSTLICIKNNTFCHSVIEHNEKKMAGIHTECVVPSTLASDIPPCVFRFSRLFTILLNVVDTSIDRSFEHNCKTKKYILFQIQTASVFRNYKTCFHQKAIKTVVVICHYYYYYYN